MNEDKVNEHILRDARYPVHTIADKLLPYLKVLVEKFEPEQIVLFGSYAYGRPTVNSDVVLLVIKKTLKSLREEATEIRKAFRPLRHTVANLAFDIMVRDPEDLRLRLQRGAAFHSIIMQKGLRLAWKLMKTILKTGIIRPMFDWVSRPALSAWRNEWVGHRAFAGGGGKIFKRISHFEGMAVDKNPRFGCTHRWSRKLRLKI